MNNKKKILLVVSDLHLGAGSFFEDGNRNYREDFFHDFKFVEFLEFYRSGKYRNLSVELVINGDFFEMHETGDYKEDPVKMTQDLALWRIKQIIKGHPALFAELRNFANSYKKAIILVNGNHDQSMLFPGVQEFLRRIIHPSLVFCGRSYSCADVYIEHGSQYFRASYFDYSNPFIRTDSGDIILNHDWGSIFSIRVLYKNKTKKHHPIWRAEPMAKFIMHIIKCDFFYLIKYSFSIISFLILTSIFELKYNFSHARTTWDVIKGLSLNFSEVQKKEAGRILNTSDYNIVIMGHVHSYNFMRFPNDKIYINTGTLNKELNLSFDNYGSWRKFFYAFIEVSNQSSAYLKEWIGHRPDVTIYNASRELDILRAV